MKTNLTKILSLFVALTITGVCLIVFGQEAAESAVRTSLPLLGTAIFGAALAFFLLRMTGQQE